MKTRPIFAALKSGDRVNLSGGKAGTVLRPAVTRRGNGDTIFVEVKLDSGVIVYPRRVHVKKT